MNSNQERRYKTARWRTVRLIVLRRDGERCWVTACLIRANVADHIQPVYEGMPDALFYSPNNLRASCKRHNTARGVAARLEREMEEGVAPEPARSGLGRTNPFLSRGRRYEWPLVKSTHTSRVGTKTGDYTRRTVDDGAA